MSTKFYEKFEKKAKSKESKKGLKTKKENISNNKIKEPHSHKDELDNGLNKNNITNKRKNSFPKNEKNKVPAKNNKQNYSLQESLFNTNKLSKETDYILQHFDEIIQGVRPLNSKQLQQLPDNIKALSHQLTDKRSERRLGYMNDNIQLSSYIRYYTWWNLVRLTRLFSNLPESSFPDKDCICLDLGTGPLTIINALWLARPELRKLKLTWYCLDVSANSMALGEDIYLSIAAKTEGADPWNIIRVKGSFGTSIKQKADFITCANMFNELDQAGDMPPEYQVKKYFEQLKSYSATNCKFLLVEPGIPKATRTIALLRQRFISSGKTIAAPCPHYLECPMNGFKAYTGSHNKWCNFAFSTEDAPAKLLKLSEQAKLPKERATLIFISVIDKNSIENKNETDLLKCRITSDPFKLPDNKTGYYGCSSLGLTLISSEENFYRISENNNSKLKSGDLISVKIKTPVSNLNKDSKSGAIILNISNAK